LKFRFTAKERAVISGVAESVKASVVTMVALRKLREVLPPEAPSPYKRELYRELCRDEEGRRYTVIVYRPFPGLVITDYELEDGTPVRFIDDCLFEIETTGRTLTRCEL